MYYVFGPILLYILKNKYTLPKLNNVHILTFDKDIGAVQIESQNSLLFEFDVCVFFFFSIIFFFVLHYVFE